MLPAASAEGAVGLRAMPDHRPGWLASSPDGIAAKLTDRLSLRRRCCPAAGSYRRVTGVHLTLPRLPCLALPLPCITAASSVQQAEPGGTPRLETWTQRGPFQKENCKAGVRSVALSTYACA